MHPFKDTSMLKKLWSRFQEAESYGRGSANWCVSIMKFKVSNYLLLTWNTGVVFSLHSVLCCCDYVFPVTKLCYIRVCQYGSNSYPSIKHCYLSLFHSIPDKPYWVSQELCGSRRGKQMQNTDLYLNSSKRPVLPFWFWLAVTHILHSFQDTVSHWLWYDRCFSSLYL